MGFEGPVEMLAALADTPEIVARVLADPHRRANHCRLWLNGAGNLTPSPYDGNLLYVFNLQLKGRKEWRIVSPHTPLRNYPFSRGALFRSGGEGSPPPKGVEYCDFALEEGDMIYLPPLWHHAVKATAESNINVNWVATRKAGCVASSRNSPSSPSSASQSKTSAKSVATQNQAPRFPAGEGGGGVSTAARRSILSDFHLEPGRARNKT